VGPGASLILAAALGVVGGAVGWLLLRDTFAKPLFARTNVRGADVPVAVGVLLPVVLVGAASLLVLAESADVVEVATGSLLTTVLAATGFGLLGLLDDLAGDGSSRGFGGHLQALAQLRLTTGAVKLFGGGAVAVLVASTVSDQRPARLLADAALIALSANLANLLDRAPGRVAKAAFVSAVPVALLAGVDGRLSGPVVVLATLAALVVPDVRERLMLGDTGANVLGATLGLAVVLVAAPSTRSIVLAVVLALNLLSERVSFSSVIARTPPLRALDRLGRLP
jgi:UDP-GlcNAc:undecaprenyl-phosphate GlcNAc-1-phosphate transferase